MKEFKKYSEYKIKKGKYKGKTYKIEAYWHLLSGNSWMVCLSNVACLNYAMRSIKDCLPLDDSVLYGHIGDLGFLIHESEIDWESGE